MRQFQLISMLVAAVVCTQPAYAGVNQQKLEVSSSVLALLGKGDPGSAKDKSNHDPKRLEWLSTLTALAKEADDAEVSKSPDYASQVQLATYKVKANLIIDKWRSETKIPDAKYMIEYKKMIDDDGQFEYKLRQIVVPTSDMAKQVLTELKTKDIAFSEMAFKASLEPVSRKNGGDLGWIGKQKLGKDLFKVASTMRKGEYSIPVKTALGWHVLFLEDKRDIQHPKFEEYKSSLKAKLEQEHIQSRIEALKTKYSFEVK